MKIILTEDVSGLGDIGQSVEVKTGYARNYLIPRGYAIEFGSKSAASLKHQMWQLETKKRRLKGAAEEVATKVRNLSLDFEVRVASGGKLFGSISAKEIAEKLKEAGLDIDRRKVLITEPLKKIGTHFVKVRLHPEVEPQLKITLHGNEASEKEEEAETVEARERIEENTAARGSRRSSRSVKESEDEAEES